MMYELLAHVYDALVKDDEATACWVELIKAHIRGTELLELACGSGEITIALAQEGYHVDASDLSAAMIEEARRRMAASRCHGVSWICVICIRIKAMTVSFVLCDSFNYLLKDEQVRALFQGAYRHLRDNGVFLVDMHSWIAWRNLQRNTMKQDMLRIWSTSGPLPVRMTGSIRFCFL